jgi:hypothetical protein
MGTFVVDTASDNDGWVIGSGPDEDTIGLLFLNLLIRMRAWEML